MHQVRVNDVGDVVLEDLPRQWVDEAEPRLDDAWAPVTGRIHFEFEVVRRPGGAT